jgi:K(+)-stimulated pyrophosphate-energized sodium pump
MDEIALIGAIAVLSLGFAASTARWLGGRAASDRARTFERLLRAGAAAMSARATRVLALPLAGFAAAVFGLHAWLGEGALHAARLETAIWALASLALGALVSWGACQLGAIVSARAAARAATHGVSREQALEIALRGAVSAAIVAAALPLLSLLALFGIALLVLAADDTPFVAARVLVGYPLGVALHGAAAQTGGAAFSAGAADAERRLALAEPGIDPDDARNPATLASLVGGGPALASARVAEAVETAGVELVGAVLVAAIVAESNRGALLAAGVAPIALVALPLLARAYGLLASIAGVLAVRTDDVEHPSDALSRGHWVTATIQLVGFAATSWLLLRPYWAWLSTAAAIGVATGYGLLLVAQYAEDPRYAPARTIADAVSGGTLRGAIVGISMGLRSAVAPVLLAIALIAVGHLSGEMTGLARGGLLGVAIAIGGFLGAAPFVQAAEGAGAGIATASALRRLRVGGAGSDETAPRRDERAPTMTPTTPHVAIGGGLAALLLVWAVVVEVERHRSLLGPASHARRFFAGLDPASPPTILAALVGTLLVVWCAGRGLLAADATRARIHAEARRLLQWLPRERGLLVYPPEGIPDPTGCVDAGTRVAAAESIEASLAVVVIAASVGAAFRWTHGLGAEAVITLAWVVALVAAPLSLALDGIATAWASARHLLAQVRVEDVAAEEWSRIERAARSLDDLGVVLGRGLATAPLSIAKLVAAAVLAFLPLFV